MRRPEKEAMFWWLHKPYINELGRKAKGGQ